MFVPISLLKYLCLRCPYKIRRIAGYIIDYKKCYCMKKKGKVFF